MPQPEIASLTQYAVLWPFAGHDKDGTPIRGTATELSPADRNGVRWEVNRRANSGPDSQPQSKTITVYVAQEITLGSQMWLGKLADLPSPLTNLFEVIDYEEIPDIKGNAVQRTVTLSRVS